MAPVRTSSADAGGTVYAAPPPEVLAVDTCAYTCRTARAQRVLRRTCQANPAAAPRPGKFSPAQLHRPGRFFELAAPSIPPPADGLGTSAQLGKRRSDAFLDVSLIVVAKAVIKRVCESLSRRPASKSPSRSAICVCMIGAVRRIYQSQHEAGI